MIGFHIKTSLTNLVVEQCTMKKKESRKGGELVEGELQDLTSYFKDRTLCLTKQQFQGG